MVEKRLFRFGKGSSALIIPKKWVEQKGLDFTSPIYLNENDSGDLTISALESSKVEREEDAGSLSQALLSRVIGFHYIYGTTRLRLYSKKGFTQKQAEEIQEEIKRHYIGFEVVNQNQFELMIEDISGSREFTIERTLSRIKYLILEEFSSAISSDDDSLKKSEELVDRFYLFGIRHLNLTRPANHFAYLRIVQMLELISDMLLMSIKVRNPACLALLKEIKTQFEMSMEALNGKEELITKSLNFGESIVRKIEAEKLTEHQRMIFKGMVWSTVAIAEVGIVWRKSKTEDLLGEKSE